MRWMRGIVLGAAIASASPALALDGLRDVHVLEVGSDEAGAFCADFLLSNRTAALSLRQSRRITQEEYVQQFDFLPCYVRGSARLGDDPVRWELRAGGNGTLATAAGEVVHLGCAECARTFGAH